MTTTQITTEQLTSVLDGLYGCDKSAAEIETNDPIENPKVISTYNNMEGQFCFAIICDLALANSLGAALTMIPPGGAEDATAEGSVPTNIAENLHEVLNICSAVFADHEHHRIVLDKVFLPGHETPIEILDSVESAETILQTEYELDRYQKGRMALLRIAN